MAKMGKVKAVSKVALKKAPKSQVSSAKKPVRLARVVSAKPKATVEVATKPNPVQKPIEAKPVEKQKVSTKLLEVIQERKKKASESGKSNFGKPMGRRGRRPKNLTDYNPEHQGEEDIYNFDSEQVNLEYDAGIRVAKPSDDGGFNLERFEDYDEELNFE